MTSPAPTPSPDPTSDARTRAVRAFVLAGGLGSRLAPLTTVIPKPLMPVGTEAVLEILVRQLAAEGIPHVTIALGHLGYLIRAVVDDGRRLGAVVDYTEEPEPLGTAGALTLLDDVVDDDILVVVNGDTFTDLDFGAVVETHRASGVAATVVVSRREVAIDFGTVEMDADGRLTAYREKPSFSFDVSIGVNVFTGAALAELPAGATDMPAFLLLLAERGYRVNCLRSEADWLDLGRIDDLREAARRRAPDPTSAPE